MADLNRTQILSADPNRTQMGAPPTVDPNRTMMGMPPTVTATVEATQTIKPVQCPVCRTFNPAFLKFCMECGLIFDRALEGDAFGAPAIQLPILLESSGREHPLRPGTNVIGREGDILTTDSRISRRHAQISNTNGTLEVEDLGSTNGTKVDGQPLSPGTRKTLNGGEKISLGGFEFQLQLPGAKGGNTTQAFAGNKTGVLTAAPMKETSPAVLVGDGREIPLRAGSNSFGRKAENDVQISDPYVSGRHGTIEITDNGVFLTDIGSSNGTLLNDAKLVANMRTQLTPDDVIRLGSLVFRVRLNDK